VTIRLERGGDGWVVLEGGVFSVSQKLEDAALGALLLAELHGTTLELGSDVPEEVIERVRRRRVALEAMRARAKECRAVSCETLTPLLPKTLVVDPDLHRSRKQEGEPL
jgi:hypothetical protein